MRLADVSSDLNAAPVDPFKVEHVPQRFKHDIAPHVHKITHWKAKEDEFVEDKDKEAQGHLKKHNWSELEKMFRCEGEERLIDKVLRNAETYEAAIEESLEKATKLNEHAHQSPRKRLQIIRGRGSSMG